METSQLLSEIQEEIGSDELLKTATRSQQPVSYNFIDLPLTRLHYIKYGEGPPLVMVPASISEINNWIPLVHFMGQRYTVHFFELPGHGQSTKFNQHFRSELVAQTVEDFINALGFESITLMGFSFGGVLSMKTLYHLQERVNEIILVSPSTTHRALPFSPIRKFLLRCLARTLKIPVISKILIYAIKSKPLGVIITNFFKKSAMLEDHISIERRIKEVKPSTLEVLIHQMNEVIYLDLPIPKIKFKQPCYFAMSIYDPLLAFSETLDVLNDQFEQVFVQKMYFSYHQPKVVPPVEEFNQILGKFLNMV
ncbi:MAG: alpha/beta hydrolase [Anaerolineae bacterium]|nr:alpha/beta hydrolase [Anaerolineae bacterium]